MARGVGPGKEKESTAEDDPVAGMETSSQDLQHGEQQAVPASAAKPKKAMRTWSKPTTKLIRVSSFVDYRRCLELCIMPAQYKDGE